MFGKKLFLGMFVISGLFFTARSSERDDFKETLKEGANVAGCVIKGALPPAATIYCVNRMSEKIKTPAGMFGLIVGGTSVGIASSYIAYKHSKNMDEYASSYRESSKKYRRSTGIGFVVGAVTALALVLP